MASKPPRGQRLAWGSESYCGRGAGGRLRRNASLTRAGRVIHMSSLPRALPALAASVRPSIQQGMAPSPRVVS